MLVNFVKVCEGMGVVFGERDSNYYWRWGMRTSTDQHCLSFATVDDAARHFMTCPEGERAQKFFTMHVEKLRSETKPTCPTCNASSHVGVYWSYKADGDPARDDDFSVDHGVCHIHTCGLVVSCETDDIVEPCGKVEPSRLSSLIGRMRNKLLKGAK